jgi:amino acid transporter
LAALSLDALSSVAYGPEAMVVVLLAAGASALRFAVPLSLVIAGMLGLLVISYTQVIAAHPDGGGAYAVAKANLGRPFALLAAASLVIDYVLTVAVSLAAGAASLGSVFPALSHHLLLVAVIGLAILTFVNLFGVTESAKLLMPPAAIFIVGTLVVIAVSPFQSHLVAQIGKSMGPVKATEALGIVLILKAFAGGCSTVTGVEAIANGAPAFRSPRTAQRTELLLGALLAVMLIGISVLFHAHHLMPRGGVTMLAQLTAGAFGKGLFFYIYNIVLALVLGLAANTSFGGLPVLMSLLARDHRLPHVFYLRAEKPVYRSGVLALAVAALLLLVATSADTQQLIPLYAIGVFIGFTLSQTGLVRHWTKVRTPRWQVRTALNATGAAMTAIAVVVFLISKFLAGAWVVVVAIPLLMVMFSRIEGYYGEAAAELKFGKTPPPPHKRDSVVIVPTSTVNLLTEEAISAALSLGENVMAVAVAGDEEECDRVKREWDEWQTTAPIEVLLDKHRSLIRTVLHYIESVEDEDAIIMVLIPEIIPRRRRHQILHNQRGRLLEAVLKARTNVIVARLPFRLHE